MTSSSTTVAPGARLTKLRDDLAAVRAEESSLTRASEEVLEQLKDLQRVGTASVNEIAGLEARKLEIARQQTKARETRSRLERELAIETRFPDRPEEFTRTSPERLESWLAVKREELAPKEAKLKAHDAARDRLRRTQSVEALARHDDARRELSLAVEQARAIVEDLERAHAAARARWPQLQSAFDSDVLAVKNEQAEGLRLLREYLEKAAPRVAAIVARLEEIDRNLAAVRERGRYLSRGAEVPSSPNHVLRDGELPLYHVGGLRPEVRLPGADHQTIWPQPRGAPTKITEATP